MYITVMDYCTSSVTKIVWDVDSPKEEEVDILLEAIGYELTHICYMVTEEEPNLEGFIEVSEMFPNCNPADITRNVKSTK